jgi:hypothetical protein
MKKLLLLLTLALCAPMTFAQNVPSYVPSDGLVGYWPFNGNANDISGNENNGTVNGATLTTDRFGNANSAYSFDGVDDYIDVLSSFFNNGWNETSINLWFNSTSNVPTSGPGQTFFNTFPHGGFDAGYSYQGSQKIYVYKNSNPAVSSWDIFSNTEFNANPILLNTWHNVSIVKSGLVYKFYFNGQLDNTLNTSIVASNYFCSLRFGAITCCDSEVFNGSLDDFGIWNRALTQEEITNLFNANQCFTNITVTDTLIINVGQLSFNDPVTWANNITIAPNPANSQININFNNITDLNGGTIKIINSLGQQVATTPITLSGTNTTIPITTWGGAGLYFVQILNAQGIVVDVKKIILQ